MRRIVLTGGPGAGKSVISLALEKRHGDRLVRVPEAATQVYERLGTRWDKLSWDQRREVQRMIYRLQGEQEERYGREHAGKILVLDRGTVDGAAYWPEGPADYWWEMGTSMVAELGRYDRVIWMQTGAAMGVYDGESSNPRRHENPPAAIALGEKLKSVWSGHPAFVCVPTFGTIEEKVGAVERLLML